MDGRTGVSREGGGNTPSRLEYGAVVVFVALAGIALLQALGGPVVRYLGALFHGA